MIAVLIALLVAALVVATGHTVLTALIAAAIVLFLVWLLAPAARTGRWPG